jgi:ABC-type amino acid transport substrate-binding protein
MTRRLTLWLTALAMLAGLAHARAEVVIYPRHQAQKDPQLQYVLDVLRLALSRSGKPYELRQASTVMVQSRAIAALAGNTGSLDVIWVMTNQEREKLLLPVRIPIDRGLIGWRVALLNAQRATLLSTVKDLPALARYNAGQMHDWPDTAVLKANGLNVIASPTYEGLFQQLAYNRIDYFPRSVMEVRQEWLSHRDLHLVMDDAILIRYPAAFYFFVSRNRPELGADIQKGLEAALADGSFLKLFNRHMRPLLEALDLPKRTVIQLQHPQLPPATPLARRELWFDLDELR